MRKGDRHRPSRPIGSSQASRCRACAVHSLNCASSKLLSVSCGGAAQRPERWVLAGMLSR